MCWKVGSMMIGCVVLAPCYAQLSGTAVLSDAQIQDFCTDYSASVPELGLSSIPICTAMLTSQRDEVPTIGMPARLDASMELLPVLYQMLQADIHSRWPSMPANRMFITEYPMVTRDQNNNVCGYDVDSDHSHNLPFVTQDEYTWAELSAGTRLNQVIAHSASELGWTEVTGIAEAFRLKGYCATPTWMVRMNESFRIGTGKWGIAHPNKEGQKIGYGEPIWNGLRRAFYPQSTATVLGPARVDGR